MSSGISKLLTSRRAKKIYLIVCLVVLLFLLCDGLIMPWFVSRGGIVEVPNVIGLSYERAQRALDSLGLRARQSETRPDLRYPQGTVMAQVPAPGDKVRPGRRVHLTISGGEPVGVVPSLRGRSLRDARFALERAGLSLGETMYLPSDEFPPNTIVDQGVQAGGKLRKGSFVSVVVSQGGSSDRLAVPNVTGRILPEAEKALTQRGLKVGNITYQENLELLPNTVLAQYPRAGDLVGLGQPVDLFVVQTGSKKPREVME
jgi:beta-lactam-binding protein with PASTA domain